MKNFWAIVFLLIRMNHGKVLQMVSLVLVALALPMTIAIYGIRDIQMPATPANVWHAIATAKASRA